MATTAKPVRQDNTAKASSTQSERRTQERRRKHQEGYVYIDVVGWYCRRVSNRRCEE